MATGDDSTGNGPLEKRRKLSLEGHDVDPFRSILYTVSRSIKKENFKELKFLCSGIIAEKSLEDMEDPLDLFNALIQTGYISKTDTGFLQNMLLLLKLPTLSEELQTFHKSQPQSEGTLTEKTERLVEYLKHIYKGHFALLQPIPWYDDLKLKLKEVYTRLEVKKVEKGATKAGKDLEGLHDMFMADEEGQYAQRIRIEGPPAMGKSTLCRKIAYDWACGELEQYKLLFFLEMRHVTGSKVIDEIFSQLLPKDLSITKDELANIISRQEKSTLFLFDGLDEIAKDKIEDCEIADHIAKKLRVYCTIVITTRPRLRDWCLSICDLYLIVKGFTKKSTNEYIDKYFKDDKDASMALKQKIKLQREDITSDSITDLLRNPLHVSFLCILWEDYKLSKKENYFPKNHTELYSEVLECTLKRYCTKKDIELNNGEIPKLVTDYRDKLAVDSYKIYSADKINFLKTDISCEQYLDLGLLVRDLGHSRIKVQELYFFYHKTWLEFFTAFYISSQLKVGDTTGLDSLFNNPQKSSPVLKFLAGISERKASGLLFDRFNQEIQTLKNTLNTPWEHLGSSKQLSSLLGQCFECVHESKQGLVSASHVQSSIKGILLYAGVKKHISKCMCMCDLTDHELSKSIRVNRTHCHFPFILHFMKLQPGQIEVLRMYQPFMTEMSMLSNTLSDTESNVMLKTLEIHMCQSESKNIVSHVDHLSKVIRNVKANASLQTLNIYFDSDNYHECTEQLKVNLEKMCAEIADNENIKNFALTFKTLTFNTCSSLQIFEEFINKGPRTVKFSMAGSKCQLSSLCNFMKKCRKTESIKLELCNINGRSDDFNQELNMCLQNMSTSIKALSLWIEGLEIDSALFDTLSTNTTLSEISIGEFTEQSIDKACDIIKHNKFARSLTLYVQDDRYNINGEAMVKSLSENKALKHLCVQYAFWYSSYEYSKLVPILPFAKAICQCSLKSIKFSWRRRGKEKISQITNFISQQVGQHHWSYNVFPHCSGRYMHQLSNCTEDDGN